MAKNRKKTRQQYAEGEFSIKLSGRLPKQDPAMEILKMVVQGLGEELSRAGSFARAMANEAAPNHDGCQCKPAPSAPPPVSKPHGNSNKNYGKKAGSR